MESNIEHEIARALLEIGAVGFNIENPITFKSGIISPVYVDNRELPYHPDKWQIVIDGWKQFLEKGNVNFDVLAGVATGGIPHSATLGFVIKKPSVFVLKEPKDHGKTTLVQGGNIVGKKVLLIEDMVSTGASSLKAVSALRNEGAVIDDCLIIVSYDFAEAREAFQNANVNLHVLTTFPVILEEAIEMGKINEAEAIEVKNWLANPHGWRK